MVSFKQKPLKKLKVDKKSTVTLDNKHQDFINEFAHNELDKIPSLKQEKKKIKHILNKNNLNPCLTIEQVMNYQDQINDITTEIKKIRNEKHDYLLNNSKYVFDYFENKKNISDGNENTKKNNLLNDFFKVKTDDNRDKDEKETTNENIFQKYLSNIDDSFLDINNFVHASDICQTCKKGELIPVVDEGIMVCNMCFVNIPHLIENEKPSYKEPPKEVCFYAYKRINHFREILAQFQAKETTQIPQKVLDEIKNQIKKERCDLSQISNKRAKNILKKLGYNKYYEHIPFIKDKLGIRPPLMSQELEDKLCNLFLEIQKPYAKHCPDGRVNFLNYYYVLYKMCELLGEKKFLPFFPMLKDPVKRIEQDDIWKKICRELRWDFVPTI